MLRIPIIALILTGLSCAAILRPGRPLPYRREPLRFTRDGTFQITIFSDLHFGESKQPSGHSKSIRALTKLLDAWDQWGPQQDINTIRVLNNVLDAEQQQLVVLNGDLITGENTFLENSTTYLDEMVQPMLDRRLPWASAYGNHDSAHNLSRPRLLAREQSYHNALTRDMTRDPTAGVTNYYLPVYSFNATTSATPALVLWFFDSRGGTAYQRHDASDAELSIPNWVSASTVSWFRRTSAELAATHGRAIPSLAFVHIPPSFARTLQLETGISRHAQPGLNDDVPLAAQAQGWCADGSEGCESGGQDSAFMAALAGTEGLRAVFGGHDHGDSWCARWGGGGNGMKGGREGLDFCFGRRSGYGGYGNWARGARGVLVREEGSGWEQGEERALETWVRLESGQVVDAVTLNSTYGRDRYPAVDETDTHCVGCDYSVITPMRKRSVGGQR